MSSIEFTYWQAYFILKHKRESPKKQEDDEDKDDELD